MSERVLLAGCGDLGERVARCLLARGDTVFALRRRPPVNDGDGVRWLTADVTDAASLAGLPPGITQLVYLPAPDARLEAAYRAVFVDGLRNLLDALQAAPLARVLLVSSSAVFGEHDGDWVDEHGATAPAGFNGAVLLEAERWLVAQRAGSVVLRLAGLYGPGRLQLIERLRRGEAVAPRAMTHWANRIHADDAASAIAHLLALPEPQSLYVGADDTPLPLDRLYAHLARLAGAPVPADGPPPRGIGSKRLSNARLRASGWTPRWPDARDGYAALLGGD